MPKFTKEQQEAIDKEGTNIIVSAGAGSGKTAVLTERVIRKLKQKVSIDKLLVLTFTKAAAQEMKDRIKKKIKNFPELEGELDKIDSAYITTFDSFSLSIVKKYHYLLNITPNVKICESCIIEVKKKQLLNEIFDALYEKEDKCFLELINNFCVKDDEVIKTNLLNIYNKIDMRYDKVDYLENYVDRNFNEEKINNDIIRFEEMLKEKIGNIKTLLEDISYYVDGDYYDALKEQLAKMLEANTYNEIKLSFPDKSLKSLPKGSDERVKKEKDKIAKIIKEIKELCIYETRDEIKEIILSTKENIKTIVRVLLQLNHQLSLYKEEYDLFEFIDIARLAIKVVQENVEIRNELKSFFNEILVDEYQDTNDLQETFISLISNNNVYMVGDIKQSIYRFRNANPLIFKNKYDNYAKKNGGIKIDLNKNFRSRREVLENINYIFDQVMDDFLGGAAYQESHRMIFGNTTYEETGNTNQNNNLEIYNYNYDKDSPYTKEEIEIFTIAKDIKTKIENHYKIFDKDNQIIRDITYNDFVILMDRTTNFELYKKIFEYLNIPLTIYKDNEVTQSTDILVISNLLKLLQKIKNKEFDQDFKYSFTSITRSFLYNLEDELIFDYITNNTYKETELYQKLSLILEKIPYLNPTQIINLLLEEFDYYNKLLTITGVENRVEIVDYIKNLTKNISSIGYTIYDLSEIIEEVLKQGLKLSTPNLENNNNSCKIMTIHKSKGLEYHICYFSGLYKKFNISDLKDLFLYDNTYGIITPYFKEGIGTTIYKLLLKDKYVQEEISEKIRLFYVSLTRCKEKMIFINCFNEEEETIYKENNIVNDMDRLKYRSFKDILDSIESSLLIFKKDININTLHLTKNYNLTKNNQYLNKIEKTKDTLKIKLNNTVFSNAVNTSFSKKTNTLLDINKINNMKFGEKMHYYLEVLDLKSRDLSYIKEKEIKEKINTFLNLDILKDVNEANIYKEYEFIYKEKNTTYHGIIDLLIEYEKKVIIIDYKLSNIEDNTYKEQLNGYKKYIESKLHKKTYIYLYSINKNQLKEL